MSAAGAQPDIEAPRPRAGRAAGQGLIRQQAADFVVDEIIEMEPEEGGEHLWLRVRKTGENTEHVARLLAQAAGIRAQQVGYAGRKDRHAVTTQWFSQSRCSFPPAGVPTTRGGCRPGLRTLRRGARAIPRCGPAAR